MKLFFLAAFAAVAVQASQFTNTTTTQTCSCSVAAIERSCPKQMDDVRRCNCIDRALRSCPSTCPDSTAGQALSCRTITPLTTNNTSNTTTSRLINTPINPSQVSRLTNQPMRPNAVICGGPRKSRCPANQICSIDPNNRKSESGFCTGAPCNMNSRSVRNEELCPSSDDGYRQICVQKPRHEFGGLGLTDVPGLCADPQMKCGGTYGGCPRGWVCQGGANGDGDPCQGDPNCKGLCMHFGDGRGWGGHVKTKV